MGTKDSAVPFLKKSVARVYETVGDRYIAMTLLTSFELFQELEVAWDYYCFSSCCALHCVLCICFCGETTSIVAVFQAFVVS